MTAKILKFRGRPPRSRRSNVDLINKQNAEFWERQNKEFAQHVERYPLELAAAVKRAQDLEPAIHRLRRRIKILDDESLDDADALRKTLDTANLYIQMRDAAELRKKANVKATAVATKGKIKRGSRSVQRVKAKATRLARKNPQLSRRGIARLIAIKDRLSEEHIYKLLGRLKLPTT